MTATDTGAEAVGAPEPLQRVRARICVPYRETPERAPLWDYTRRHWQSLGVEIATGDDGDRVFNRAMSRNLAAIGRWDVAIFVDADTVMRDHGPVLEAVEIAHRDACVVIPHDRYIGLTAQGTSRLLAGQARGWDNVKREKETVPLGVAVVSRPAWETLGGFDERFAGWGGEDVAFRVAASTLTGLVRLPGTIYHLWHPIDPTKMAYLRQQNGGPKLRQRYADAAAEGPDAMRALLDERE